jgi:hypothetical protein
VEEGKPVILEEKVEEVNIMEQENIVEQEDIVEEDVVKQDDIVAQDFKEEPVVEVIQQHLQVRAELYGQSQGYAVTDSDRLSIDIRLYCTRSSSLIPSS